MAETNKQKANELWISGSGIIKFIVGTKTGGTVVARIYQWQGQPLSV